MSLSESSKMMMLIKIVLKHNVCGVKRGMMEKVMESFFSKEKKNRRDDGGGGLQTMPPKRCKHIKWAN